MKMATRNLLNQKMSSFPVLMLRITVDGFEATTSKDKTGVVTITATHKDTGVSGALSCPLSVSLP